eukprot:TRINITY_DN4019_c0_g1_i1.p1 TRINITY_DN4019_c0_g1~~TRINITY_DN4019_c0_g1_i1.p1  ORF type:complete len:449 (-),score=31.97 TRINITY_DN4019_c0_g1_i1:35-1219(-)
MVGGANSCGSLTIFGLFESTCCNVFWPITRTFRTMSVLLCFQLVASIGALMRGHTPCLNLLAAPMAFLLHGVDWHLAVTGSFEATSASVCQLNEIARKWQGVYDLIPRVVASLILVSALLEYVSTRGIISRSRFSSKAVLRVILNRTSSYIVVAVVCLTPYIAMDGDHVAEWTTSLIRGLVFILFNLTGILHALLYFINRSAVHEMYVSAQREHSRRIRRQTRIRALTSLGGSRNSALSSRSSCDSGMGGRTSADLELEGEFLAQLHNFSSDSKHDASEPSVLPSSLGGGLLPRLPRSLETPPVLSEADSSTLGTAEWEEREHSDGEMASWDCSTGADEWELEQERQRVAAAQRREAIERWQSSTNWYTRHIRRIWTLRTLHPASQRTDSPRPS